MCALPHSGNLQRRRNAPHGRDAGAGTFLRAVLRWLTFDEKRSGWLAATEYAHVVFRGIVMHLGKNDKPSLTAAPLPAVPKAGRFALLESADSVIPAKAGIQ